MKKIIKSICFSVLAFLLAIGSFFVPITSRNINSAHADTTSPSNTTFISSDIIFTQMGNINNATAVNSGNFNVLLYDYASQNGGIVVNTSAQFLNWQFYIDLISYEDGVGNVIPYFEFSAFGFYGGMYGTLPLTGSDSQPRQCLIGQSVSYTALGGPIYEIWSPIRFKNTTYVDYSILGAGVKSPLTGNAPTLIMKSIELGNYRDFPGYVDEFPSRFSNSNIVCYTDTADYKYFFFIPSWNTHKDNDSNPGYLDYRKYYTSYSESFNNNEFYQQGLSDGFSSGYDDGFNEGYSRGSNYGYEEGLEEGKIIGAVQSNDYSFFGLISAVIDTPIQLFKSLFNFNFLGVNLFAFFTSILTIGLIVFVTKLFLRR